MSECNEVTNLSRVETACRMKRSRIQGHGEEGWGSRGSRFDRGRAIAPGAIAPELSVDEFSRFRHVRCASSESRSDPELLVSSPEDRPAGREAMVDRRLDRLLDRRLVVESDRCVAGCIGLDLLSVVLMARLRVASALTGDGGLGNRTARGSPSSGRARPRSGSARAATGRPRGRASRARRPTRATRRRRGARRRWPRRSL